MTTKDRFREILEGAQPPPEEEQDQALDPIAQVREDFANFPNVPGGTSGEVPEAVQQKVEQQGAPQQSSSTRPPFTEGDLAFAARLGLTPEDLEGFRVMDQLGRPTNRVNWQALIDRARAGEALAPEQGQSPARSFEELLVRNIEEHGLDSPEVVALDNFRRRPASGEALQQALEFTRNPADVFTLSAFARGFNPNPPPSREEGIRPFPRPPRTQQLFEQFMQEALGEGGQQPSTEQTVQQERPREVEQSPQLQRASGGLPGDFSEQVGQPEGLAQPRARGPRQRPQSPEPQTATRFQTPGQGEPLASALSGQQLGTLTPDQLEFVESRQAGGDPLLPPEKQAGLIPEETRTSTTKLGGVDVPIPVGLEPLFQGEAVDRPGSLLGEAGLPLPSQQSLRNMTSGERANFAELARVAGIPQADLQSELESVLPAPSRRRRTTTAARRANG